MRVCLWDGLLGLYVVPHDLPKHSKPKKWEKSQSCASPYHVAEAERRGGAVGKMTEDESIGIAAVLVKDDKVCDFVLLARLHYLFGGVAAAVHPLRIWNQKPNLLQKHLQSAAGVVAGGHHNLRVRGTGTRIPVHRTNQY